ncbi:MAG: sigma-54-dependent Fis family transcriptional regulator [Crocinitomicaceae bacterium]|nr:sigma-54-dependent Fis family transcriptional regulator [Crocinitomicaceae bacterium]
MTNKNILVVDDSSDMLELIKRSLSGYAIDVFTSTNVMDAIELLQTTEMDLVITDINMPGISGESLVKYVTQHFEKVPVLVITGYPNIQNAVSVMQLGAKDYLIKPFTIQELEDCIWKIIPLQTKPVDHVESQPKPILFQGMVGKSASMQRLFELIKKTSNTTASVLITGDSGTGKEMVARAIHYSSKFATQPFVAVNCGAIPEQLLESELFGHVKGAFTGATNDKKGLFQAANGGTLFLDEITNSSQNVQAKLLRAIQEREVYPVGSIRSEKVQLRIISASNENILEAVAQGKFREDLYYRLNVIHMEIPTLKDRREDIPLLVNHFNDKLSKINEGEPLNIPTNVMEVLQNYEWPGNIRELENFIHRLVVLAEETVQLKDLPNYMKLQLQNNETVSNVMLSLEEVERRHIAAVLKYCDNNKTKAAKILQIDRKTLRNKLEGLK